MRSIHVLAALALTAAPFVAQAASPEPAQQYTVTNLVSDIAGNAAVTDPNLVNPWGLSRSSSGPWWVADNGPGLSTLYKGDGTIIPLVVPIPPSNLTVSPTGVPTGTVFNGTKDFVVGAAPAVFLFATEDGTISGWNGGPSAVLAVNEGTASVFKGLTMG
ncbi:MAG TPA: TIGR03118 family protein, partial [Acidisarcina sp.]